MRIYFNVIFALTVFSHFAFAQRNAEPTKADIETATALKEQFPDDNVALLNSTDEISFRLNTSTSKVEVFHKMKENLINLDSRADIQKYCFYDGESSIEKFEIFYRNERKLKLFVNDEAYKNDEFFHNDSRVKYVNLDFPLKGYNYKTFIERKIKDVKYFTSLYFTDDYPTVRKKIKIEVPNWLDIELKEINFDSYKIVKEVAVNTKANSRTYTFTAENLPARFDEKNTPGPSHVYPHILVLAKSYTMKGSQNALFSSTQDLYNWYISLVSSLENDTSAIKEKVRELTENVESDEEKIKNIYYWVQDNIRYIAFEDGIAGFKPDEAANVFNKRYGDCKGMANLTKQMLIEAGFDARLTWIGTKHIAYDYSTPNLLVDNHMICSLFKDEKIIFLDATEKFNAFGEYADRIQGKQVLIENGEEFILTHVPDSDAAFNKEQFDYNLELSDNEQLVGSVDKQFQGESRSSLLYYFNNLKTNHKDEFLEYYLNQGNSNIEVSNISTSDLLNRDVDIDIAYDIAIKNAVSSFDGEIYIDLDFDKELANYKMEKRYTDYIFSSKKQLESKTVLSFPEGYKISYLPENIAVSNDNFDLKVEFQKKENALVYQKKFKIKNAKIETSDFEIWNQFIDQLNAIYNQQIILTKD
ncbi:MAG: transglutaminase-like domain-containing protein [Bacteroidota bacterium]